MSDRRPKQKLDEGLTSFFFERLCQEADLVFRFGLALHLNRKAAHQFATETYARNVSNLADLQNEASANIRVRLLRVGYEYFQGLKERPQADDVALLKFLQSLKQEARAALFLIDVAGLTATECGFVMGIAELEVRRNLASGRRGLLEFAGQNRAD